MFDLICSIIIIIITFCFPFFISFIILYYKINKKVKQGNFYNKKGKKIKYYFFEKNIYDSSGKIDNQIIIKSHNEALGYFMIMFLILTLFIIGLVAQKFYTGNYIIGITKEKNNIHSEMIISNLEAKELGTKIVVNQVYTGTIAEKVGLKVGYYLYSLNGIRIYSFFDLDNAYKDNKNISIFRKNNCNTNCDIKVDFNSGDWLGINSCVKIPEKDKKDFIDSIYLSITNIININLYMNDNYYINNGIFILINSIFILINSIGINIVLFLILSIYSIYFIIYNKYKKRNN